MAYQKPMQPFKVRLKIAMEEQGLSQVQLAEKAELPKASITQWLQGKYEAKQEGVAKLAIALNVNEAWLMGFDCPKDRCTPEQKNIKISEVDPVLSQIIQLYHDMDEEGQKLLLEQAEFYAERHKKKTRTSSSGKAI